MRLWTQAAIIGNDKSINGEGVLCLKIQSFKLNYMVQFALFKNTLLSIQDSSSECVTAANGPFTLF